jgi:hypothetical protein
MKMKKNHSMNNMPHDFNQFISLPSFYPIILEHYLIIIVFFSLIKMTIFLQIIKVFNNSSMNTFVEL